MGLTAIVAGVVGAAGVGTSLYGMEKQQAGYKKQQEGYNIQQQAAAEAAGYNKNIVADEQAQEGIRRQAMQLDAHRNTLQVIRQAQQARAQNIAAATAQGAGFSGFGQSSALSGGLAQVHSQAGYNILGINQNLEAGNKMFDINADISQQKMKLADTQTMMAQGQGQVAMGTGMVGQGAGYMSLGGQLVSSAGTFSNIAGFGAAQFKSPIANPTTYNPGVYGSLY